MSLFRVIPVVVMEELYGTPNETGSGLLPDAVMPILPLGT